MSTRSGVWIDHRHSVIVTLTSTDEQVRDIVSSVEKHLERGGDSPLKGSYEPNQVPADDRRQRALTGKLNIYYDSVVAVLRDSEGVLLFGPGEAKRELHKRLIRAKLAARVLAVETADKMTTPQIVAKVHAYFRSRATRPT